MRVSDVKTKIKLPREGALFVAASLVAGLGHYAFQILASRRLSGSEFASLSGWQAHLGLAFVVAGLAQYASNFNPLAPARLRPLLRGGVAAAFALVGTWWWGLAPIGPAAALVVGALAIIYGWVLGQAQIRLDFAGIAVAQVALALVKVITPYRPVSGLTAFSFAIGFSYLPGILILAWRLRSCAEAEAVAPRAPGRSAWTAPVLLSLAANLIPQYDLILTQHILGAAEFDAFARASLFYKGIYFFVFIFAQWVLPRQIRGDGRWSGLGLAAAFAGAASVGLAVTAPLFGRYLFGWAETPDRWLIFLSCVHMSVLTLIFLNLQADCAAGRTRAGLAILTVLGVEGALQLLVAPSALTYLLVACTIQGLLLLIGIKFHSRPPA